VVASFGGRVYAGVHVLGASPDGHTLYVVATAQEITLHNGVVTLASGTGDIPLRFDVTGTGSATRIIGVHTTPNSVHTSPAEARALFPEGLADRYLTRQDTAADRSDAQLLARARADAAAGTLLPS
jgi:sugar lactone lactonase YvrE